VCLSSKVSVAEAQYIIEDCGAKLLITSPHMAELARQLAPQLAGRLLFMVGDASEPWRSWDRERAALPTTPISDQSAGADMLYSSGTTGRPKGIKAPLPIEPIEAPNVLVQLATKFYGLGPDSVYLSPAPLYHAAPLRWCVTVNYVGGTVILMDRFDPQRALELIERYKVTHAQWVPTHFVRMLRLPPEVRARYDVSSMQVALHAAAPCAIPVKEAMIRWWGPVVHEYYAGTEGNGMTAITAAEWLKKKGSVGRAINGEIRICNEAGEPVPPRTEGTIYFAGGRVFEYHNAPAKTRETRNRYGWSTLGDVGYVDEEGYLFLTDRKAFMIISGGVNIYPQEIENLLITHPAVMDVAVFGVPDEEMGEQVVAVVQPVDFAQAGPALANELLALARGQLSHVKVPRLVEFTRELPRHANGKLYKRLLRDEFVGRTKGSG
jgi:long-chain acyl-CoA synthetase